MRKRSRILPAALSLLFIAGMAIGQDTGDALKKGFEDPPNTARPLVLVALDERKHHQEGIRLDLE